MNQFLAQFLNSEQQRFPFFSRMLITKYFVNNNAITLARYVSAFNMNVRTKSVIDGFNMANFIIGISSGVYHRDL